MCTLTYIPTATGYIFTHNRDERNNRPTSPDIQEKQVSNKTLYFPQDLEAFGSWIAFSEGRSACLLNGGSEVYTRKASYRKSRGLVVLESFEFDDIEKFNQNYDFSDIEPFTLLIRTQTSLYCIIHNETTNRLTIVDPTQSHIWSSTTLYTEEVRSKREQWFNHWLQKDPEINEENIQGFHLSAGDGDGENDLIMSRWGILQTLSLTQISVTEQHTTMLYHDIVNDRSDQININL